MRNAKSSPALHHSERERERERDKEREGGEREKEGGRERVTSALAPFSCLKSE
jgi:hypothetical protein